MTSHAESDLHDLFEFATADLPPLPDLAAGARRIVRRRRLIERSLGAVLCAALVIGAGTLALDSPWRTSFNATTALHDYKTRAAALLQQIWPVKGEIIMPASGSSQSFQIVAPDGTVSPVTLEMQKLGSPTLPALCNPNKAAGKVCASLSMSSLLNAGHANLTGPGAPLGDAAIVQYFHSGVMMNLYIYDQPAQLVSDAQLQQLLRAPQLASLVELALADRQATELGQVPDASGAS